MEWTPERIRALRTKLRLDQEAFAEALGFGSSSRVSEPFLTSDVPTAPTLISDEVTPFVLISEEPTAFALIWVEPTLQSIASDSYWIRSISATLPSFKLMRITSTIPIQMTVSYIHTNGLPT